MSNTRRKFMATTLGSGLAVAGTMRTAANEVKQEAPAGKVDRRPFGRTGAQVSIYGLGLGSAFREPLKEDPEETQRILMRALDLGINYWDTARAYRESEEMIGPVVEKRRDEIFLVSKSGDRTYDGFMRELETSLKNLRTDHLDLYHIHNLKPKEGDTVELLEKGAARAVMKAKEEGLVKNFGVTGHSGAQILIDCVHAFDPDALLTIFPANRPDEGRYEDVLLPLAVEKKMGVVAMKTLRHVRNSDRPPAELISYALSLPGVAAAIVGTGAMEHLESNARLASGFVPMQPQQRQALSKQVLASIPSGLPQVWDLPGYEDAIV